MGRGVCIGSMTEVTITRSGGARRRAGRARLIVAALTCGGAALIAGCTSSSPSNANNVNGASKAPKPPGTSASQSPSDAASGSPAASGTPNAAACVHINSLRTSLTSLTHIKVSATSASQLSKDLANIQTQLTALKGQNLGSFSTQAKELTADLNKIKKDAAELSSNPAKGAKSLTADLTVIKTKAGPMIASTKKACHVS